MGPVTEVLTNVSKLHEQCLGVAINTINKYKSGAISSTVFKLQGKIGADPGGGHTTEVLYFDQFQNFEIIFHFVNTVQPL